MSAGDDSPAEQSRTRAQQRAAGAKNTALFEIVNRKDAPVGMGAKPTGQRARIVDRSPDERSDIRVAFPR
jgi:hypothetical protein